MRNLIYIKVVVFVSLFVAAAVFFVSFFVFSCQCHHLGRACQRNHLGCLLLAGVLKEMFRRLIDHLAFFLILV